MTRALSDEFRCQELVELVTTYLDGAMGIDERTRFEQHLTYCGGCHAYVGQLRAQRRVLAALRDPPPDAAPVDVPDSTRATLLDAFRAWKQGRGE